jgi:hypothetical protein
MTDELQYSMTIETSHYQGVSRPHRGLTNLLWHVVTPGGDP